MKSIALAVVALIGLAAPAVGQDSTGAATKPPKKDPNVIAEWEIDQAPGNIRDAYELIQYLRPRFFQVRSRLAAGENPVWGQGPGVLIDDAPRGGISALRAIPISAVREIRYLSGPDAANRYGVEYHAGAILVIGK